MVSSQDVERLVAPCRSLAAARGDYREADFVTNLLATVVDFQMQTTTVVRAIEHFKTHRWDEIRNTDDLTRLLGRYPDTKDGNTALAQYLWGYNLWTRAQLLRGLVRYFDTIDVRDQQALTTWAAASDCQRDFEGRVKGLGFAVYKWLVMRQGVETVKPDVHMRRFVEAALGRPLADACVVEAVERAAKALGLQATALDWAIWETQRDAGRIQPVPPLEGPTLKPLEATLEAALGVGKFVDDDAGYLRWLAVHPTGYVLNCDRQPKPGYLILHRASCRFVTGTPPRGQRWTAQYVKVCASTTAEIEEWAVAAVGAAPRRCRVCHT